MPESLRSRYRADGLTLREFGTEQEDLNLDFGSGDRPRLEQGLLACCTRTESGGRLDTELFAELELGKRTEALLRLMGLTAGADLEVHLQCSNAGCGKLMELEIEVNELCGLQRAAEEAGPPCIEVGGERFLLRRPTGVDQAEWKRASYPDERAAAAAMVESLVPEEFRLQFERLAGRDEGWVVAAGKALEETDPLVEFRVGVACPFCDTQGSYRVDLAHIAIRRLRSAQVGLIESVHRLAAKYHWSERAIFEVPAWRRRLYLSMVEREENR
jgi:hypothetical protein